MLKKMMNKLTITLLLISLAFVFAGCGNSTTKKDEAKKPETKIEQIKKAGKIVLGTSADWPPYEFHKQINGKDEIIGFDIEIAKEIAKDLGVELEIKDMDFDGLLAALDSGNVDFVMAGMTPTEERKKHVDFTNIYYTAAQALVVKSEVKNSIKSIEDLNGKKIGVQRGSVQEEIAKNQIKGANVKSLGKVSDIMLELKNSKVDGVVVELPVASSYVSKNKDIALTDVKFEDEVGGSAIAVKKGNAKLLEVMNNTLDRLVKEDSINKFVTDATEAVE